MEPVNASYSEAVKADVRREMGASPPSERGSDCRVALTEILSDLQLLGQGEHPRQHLPVLLRERITLL